MTNHAGEHFSRANTPFSVLLIVMLIMAVTATTMAKSLYIIGDIHAEPTPLQAYDIAANGTLTFQTEYNVPRHSEYGPVGLAIDSDSTILFVTYERSNVIQLVNATTMTDAGTTTAAGADNLAGIIYDHDKGLLYCVDRNKDKLYAYDWEASTTTLTQVPGSPFTLTGATAFGIALDEINDLLYVANNSTTINVYHTSDWSLKETISVSGTAISIAVDATRGFVYYGAGFVYNYYLAQYNLGTQKERHIKVEPDAGVMGLGVDPATGMIYVGTGSNNKAGGDNIKVYNTSLHHIDIITNIGNPTGLAIPIEDVSYNPLNLYKNIAGSSINEVEYVQIGGTITYTVCFDNKDNDYTVNNVSIVDNLPNEVSFVTADGDGMFGQYNPMTHSYRWSYSSLAAGFPGDCLNLLVQVNPDTVQGTTITNSVTIDSDETGPTTTSFDVVTDVISYNPLNLSKNIIGSTLEQTDISKLESTDVGDTIVYGICFDNKDNQYTVTNVSIVDALPKEVSFVTADGDGSFGQYDPITHTYRWSYSSLEPGFQSDCLKLVVQVNPDTALSTTVTNSVTIDSDETGPTTASVDVITKAISYNPLNLSKNIIGGTIEQTAISELRCADVGDTIIYGICFDNKDNDYTVTNVSIVDYLPYEVSFVRAYGDGIFGYYDVLTHTYTWHYQSLLPRFSGACLTLVVQVNQATIPGMTINNLVVIDSDETEPATASVDVVICECLLDIGDLVAHWTMDDNAANTTVIDSSGRGNHGSTQRSTYTLATIGMINGALLFNGVSDYVKVNDQEEWTLRNDFTITLWARFDMFDSRWWWESAFMGHDEGPYERNKWIFSYDRRQETTIFHINGPYPHFPFNGYAIRGNVWTANIGVWYFVGVSRRGNTYTFYRDGVADGSKISSVTIPNISAPLTIGWAERPGKFDGALDDVRIYDKALSGEEIAALYVAGLTGSPIIPCQ